MSSSGEQKRRPGAPDDTDGKRRLRTVNTYPDPYLVTKLPIEAKVSSGVIRVGEKTILGFIHRPFPDGTPVRVVYDEWLFAERIDEPPPVDESAEEDEDSSSGSGETVAAGDSAAGDASPNRPAEVVEAPGAIDEPAEVPASSSEVDPLPEVEVEPTAAEKGRSERAGASKRRKARADRTETSLAGSAQPTVEGASGANADQGAELGGATQPRLIEPALPVSTGSVTAAGASEPSGRTPDGSNSDPFPDDLTESGTPGSEGERRGRRDSWTDAFRRPEEDD